jgi:hypothetical protein
MTRFDLAVLLLLHRQSALERLRAALWCPQGACANSSQGDRVTFCNLMQLKLALRLAGLAGRECHCWCHLISQTSTDATMTIDTPCACTTSAY